MIGLLDPSDRHHDEAVSAMRQTKEEGMVVLPASALAEILVGASRLGQPAIEATEAAVDGIVDLVQDITRAVARSAAAYRSRYRTLRLPDALILAVGHVMEASAVLTADAKWAGLDERVRLIAGHPTPRVRRP